MDECERKRIEIETYERMCDRENVFVTELNFVVIEQKTDFRVHSFLL